MLTAFLLGFTGSFGHCTGMCSGVALLLSRKRNAQGWRVLLLHLGRITTYALLGALAGGLGGILVSPAGHDPFGQTHASHSHPTSLTALEPWQGVLALVAALVALYMAIALLGRAPSPEIWLNVLTRWWGRTMRQVSTRHTVENSTKQAWQPFADWGSLYALGLLWGLLPCGLVLAALLAAAVAGSSTGGALTMLAFGLGTAPVALGIGWTARTVLFPLRSTFWLRPLAALVVFLFGVQMALRGLAVWGWVDHLAVGGMMVW